MSPTNLPTLERAVNAWEVEITERLIAWLYPMLWHLGIESHESLDTKPVDGYHGYHIVELIRLFPHPLQQRVVDMLWAYDAVGDWDNENAREQLCERPARGRRVMGRGKSLKSIELIDAAYEILEVIHPASVRAVCYQLFNRKLIASMSKNDTNRVSTQLRDARENEVIPWHWIVDETREAECVNAWEDPAAYIETVKRAYRRDRWTDQPHRIEVWSEKGTVRGTLAPVLAAYGVTFRVMHGYGSTTTVHDVAEHSLASSKPMTAFYVGDWDCSGLHMSDVDLPERLERYGADITIIRVALTKAHVAARDLPGFSADEKEGDTRHAWFVKRYGRRCWELDALNPVILRDAVESAIVEHLDMDAWTRAEQTEQAERESLATILDAWPGISRQARE